MIHQRILVSIKNAGYSLCRKKDAKIPTVKWSMWTYGGRVPESIYHHYQPKVPKFLWWYFKDYYLEYAVWPCRETKMVWERILSMDEMDFKGGEIFYFETTGNRYIMTKNPITGVFKPHYIQTNEREKRNRKK